MKLCSQDSTLPSKRALAVTMLNPCLGLWLALAVACLELWLWRCPCMTICAADAWSLLLALAQASVFSWLFPAMAFVSAMHELCCRLSYARALPLYQLCVNLAVVSTVCYLGWCWPVLAGVGGRAVVLAA
eukprot:scaffold21737_cov22-Tisochrysis_lutea.AAC.1